MPACVRSYVLLIVFTALVFALQTASADSTNRYVAWNSATAAVPYTNWITAASNIQDAIDAALASDVIWVSNGVYETGGRTNYPAGYGLLTNRVVIDKAITVRSANNDPTNTIIKGAWHPVTTNGAAAVRCVYMVNGSSLIGFTLTNGATLPSTAVGFDQNGGGVYCPSANFPIISNCVFAGNSANSSGGGSWLGSLFNCQFTGNSAPYGGGEYNAFVHNCLFTGNSANNGGGTYNEPGGGALFNCMIVSNSAVVVGGGVCRGVASNCTFIGNSAAYGGGEGYADLYNCVVVNNSASQGGGGVYFYGNGLLYNCTIVSNTATAGGLGGGVCTREGPVVTIVNCVIYFNTAGAGANYYQINAGEYFYFTNSCTAPSNTYGWVVGNITNDPMFVGKNSGNYRLSADSPCVNTGTNQSWMTGAVDLDGRQRIRYGTVDMGAYEVIYNGTFFVIRGAP